MAFPKVFSRESLFVITQGAGCLAGIGLVRALGFGGFIPFTIGALAIGIIVRMLITASRNSELMQLAVSTSLLILCLGVALLFHKPPIPSQASGSIAAAAPVEQIRWDDTSTQTPIPPPNTTPTANWNASALAFEQAHPELHYGGNYAIMQFYIDQIGASSLSNQDVIQRAYAAARNDPHWSRQAGQ